MNDRKSGADPLLIVLAGLATLIGIIAIWDAGYAKAAEKGQIIPQEVINQTLFAIVSCAIAWGVSKIDRLMWRRWANALVIVTILLLAAVMVVGSSRGGATRWIAIGSFTLQPSEFAKTFMIVYMAAAFAFRKPIPKPPREPRHWTQYVDWKILPILKASWPIMVTFIVFALIEIQPDLHTGAVILACMFGMMIAAGIRGKYIAILAAGLTLVTCVAVMKESYRFERFTNFTQRWERQFVHDEGFQSTQSEAANARGGTLGMGMGEGEAKHKLPVPTSDFIMTTIAEEFGFVGVCAVLVLLGAITMRLVWLAARADMFPKLILTGVAIWIGLQVLVNVVMANGSVLPPIGIPMPFLSAGGSSLLAIWLAIGVCQGALARVPERVKEGAHADRRHRRRDGRTRISRA